LTNPKAIRRPSGSFHLIRSPGPTSAALALRAQPIGFTSLGWDADRPPFPSTAPMDLAGTVQPLGFTSLGWDADRPKGTRRHPLLYSSPWRLCEESRHGEAGIRTLGGGFPPQLLSRQLPSAARPPLLVIICGGPCFVQFPEHPVFGLAMPPHPLAC
jgi:hypothetical protein